MQRIVGSLYTQRFYTRVDRYALIAKLEVRALHPQGLICPIIQ